MAALNCFSLLVGKKKKVKGDGRLSPEVGNNGVTTLQVKLEQPLKSSEHGELNSTTFSVPVALNTPGPSTCKVKVTNRESLVEREAVDVAYEGEDECEDKSPVKWDNSDHNLQAHDIDSSKADFQLGMTNTDSIDPFVENKSEVGANHEGIDTIQGGHVSDPGMSREERWASPRLKRSCSCLDTREVLKKIADQLPPSKSQSFEELQELAEKVKEDVFSVTPCSQSSALSHRSADKVMLKKHSSSQVLPSRSRRLWWKLFLWSHRNLQRPSIAVTRVTQLASLNQQGGYSSDTLESGRAKQLGKLDSPGSFSEICSYKSGDKDKSDGQKWDGFNGAVSGLWPQNQWVAFSGGPYPLKRVDEWVKDLEIRSIEGENVDELIVFPPSPEAIGSVAKVTASSSRHKKINLSAELLHANSVIQSLNSSSTVAHISGLGLKVIPVISQFSSLRSVNLSNNSIVQITPGSLPKGLHVLDLSRSKINTVEGLRDLTRLRVLDLSYNRISRIGPGLANCTLLKELYLAGNRISDVEGLHRLLKLSVIDLSFNKITATKALGQLVANYNSLLALNLLGNPIQTNLSEDQLRKAVSGLLPKLAYLNKQPVNQQKAREVSMDIIAKASSRGSNSWAARKRSGKKVGQSGAPLSSSLRSNASLAQRSRHKSKRQSDQPSTSKMRA